MPDHYAADSMTPAPISVSKNSFGNELASDQPSHAEATPGMGALNFGGKQYSEDFMGGFSSYGQSVSAPGASRETTTVDNSKSPLKRPDNG